MKLKTIMTKKYVTLQNLVRLNVIPIRAYATVVAITLGVILAGGMYSVAASTQTAEETVEVPVCETPLAVIDLSTEPLPRTISYIAEADQPEIFIAGSVEANAYEEVQCERIATEYIMKMDELQCINELPDFEVRAECREQWFKEYKALIASHESFLEPADTIYTVFDAEELQLLFAVVQAEIGDEWNFEQKANVASVIFNRMKSDRFPDTITEILCPSQFETVLRGMHENAAISETTILACEYAFSIGDTTGGCVYFEGRQSHIHAAYSQYVMNDNAHNFYRLED